MRSDGDGGRSAVGVLVVDDQLFFRQAAREVIDATDDFEVLGEASSGAHALAAVAELHPDLVLLDLRMPGMDGIETAARLRSTPSAPLVVLISVDDPPNLRAALPSGGVHAFVRKQDFCSALLHRLWSAHRRERAAGRRGTDVRRGT